MQINDPKLLQLSQFLIERDTTLPLTELQGFLTAILSGPAAIKPSQWLSLIGMDKRSFSSKQQAKTITDCLMTFYAMLAQQLESHTFALYTSFYPDAADGEPSFETAAHAWAKGYLLGVYQNAKAWFSQQSEPKQGIMTSLLFPIIAITLPDDILQQQIDSYHLTKTPAAIRQSSREFLPQLAIGIYVFWSEYRKQ